MFFCQVGRGKLLHYTGEGPTIEERRLVEARAWNSHSRDRLDQQVEGTDGIRALGSDGQT